jgi:cytosine/uracil/thiamine/allantoin permease
MLKRYLAIGGVVIILAGLGLMWWLDREAPAVETATIPTGNIG